MTFLYVMSVGGYHKVGIAKNPEARRRELQTGNPKKIALLGVWGFEEYGIKAQDLEYDMHRALAPHRVCGEWFDAPIALIMHTKKICLYAAIERKGYPRKGPAAAVLSGFMRRWKRMCVRPVFAGRFSAFWAERFRESDAYCRQEVG